MFVGIGGIILLYRLRVQRMFVLNTRLQTLPGGTDKRNFEQKYFWRKQVAEIQMANGALQEKNVEPENVLGVERERG